MAYQLYYISGPNFSLELLASPKKLILINQRVGRGQTQTSGPEPAYSFTWLEFTQQSHEGASSVAEGKAGRVLGTGLRR